MTQTHNTATSQAERDATTAAAPAVATDVPSASRQKINTYLAIIILLAGVAAGSFFVDIAQLFSGKGFSARALKDAQVVEYDRHTWVRYDDPKVVVEVFDEDDCPECVTDEMLVQLRAVVPTMEVHRVDVATDAGKKYAAQQNIAYIPSFLFSSAVKDTHFYQQAEMLFTPVADGAFQFNTAAIGMPVGKHIVAPDPQGGVTFGDADAPIAVVVFADYTASDAQSLHATVDGLRATYGDSVRFVVKMPVNTQNANARKMSEAVLCAAAQDKTEAFLPPYFAGRARLLASQSVEDDLIRIAATARMDATQFESCVRDGHMAQQLADHAAQADRFAIGVLPTAFVGGNIVDGELTRDALAAAIDAQRNN